MDRKTMNFQAAKKILDERNKQLFSSRQESNSEKKQDILWAELPKKTNPMQVRFLPAYSEDDVVGFLYYRHYNMPLPADNKPTQHLTCFKTWGLECEVCNQLEKYKDYPKMIEADIAVGSSFHNVLVYNAINERTGEQYREGIPHILRSGEYTYYWLLQQIFDNNIGDITDPINGSVVTFKRKFEKGAFERTVARKSEPIASSESDIALILKQMYNFKEVFRKPDDEYYKKAIAIAQNLQEKYETILKNTSDVAGKFLEKNPNTIGSENLLNKSTTIGKPANCDLECYGNHDGKSRDCVICMFENDCENATKQNK